MSQEKPVIVTVLSGYFLFLAGLMLFAFILPALFMFGKLAGDSSHQFKISAPLHCVNKIQNYN